MEKGIVYQILDKMHEFAKENYGKMPAVVLTNNYTISQIHKEMFDNDINKMPYLEIAQSNPTKINDIPVFIRHHDHSTEIKIEFL